MKRTAWLPSVMQATNREFVSDPSIIGSIAIGEHEVHALREITKSMEANVNEHHSKLRSALEDRQFSHADRHYAALRQGIRNRRALEQLLRVVRRGSRGTAHQFFVGSSLLLDGFRHLQKIPTESIMYAAGTRFDSITTVERLHQLQLEESQYGYAAADLSHTTKVLCEFDNAGAVLSAYLHMHPGSGQGANRPSSIDLANQERMERGGFITIGIIYTRDGFVRFFTNELEFEVVVGGTGTERTGDNEYRLTNI